MGRITPEMDLQTSKFYTELICIIHQQSLCRRTLKFEHVVNVVAYIVNFIGSYGLNHRQFEPSCLANWCWVGGRLVWHRSLMAESWDIVEMLEIEMIMI